MPRSVTPKRKKFLGSHKISSKKISLNDVKKINNSVIIILGLAIVLFLSLKHIFQLVGINIF
ncbi:MAG: hypothetical protein CMF41_04215 [Legionellales bacterium]|nr:hypothetical protein [Legionellales bacterium]